VVGIKPGKEGCGTVDLKKTSISKYLSYEISYEEDLIPVQVFVVERVSDLGIEETKALYQGDKGMIYNPSKLTTDASLLFCLPEGVVADKVNIRDLKVRAYDDDPYVFVSSENDLADEYSVPEVEFVALNQTKYLVRIGDYENENTTLVFGKMFDKGWLAREVDPLKAASYFTGKTKEYLDGNVIEYELKDKHILTDYIFPGSKSKRIEKSQYELNGYANAWDINDGNKVYLIEYDLQNDLYKASFVSSAGFIFMVFLSMYELRKNNN
jgi:hypothetical protein